jgi:hypothetical protein
MVSLDPLNAICYTHHHILCSESSSDEASNREEASPGVDDNDLSIDPYEENDDEGSERFVASKNSKSSSRAKPRPISPEVLPSSPQEPVRRKRGRPPKQAANNSKAITPMRSTSTVRSKKRTDVSTMDNDGEVSRCSFEQRLTYTVFIF